MQRWFVIMYIEQTWKIELKRFGELNQLTVAGKNATVPCRLGVRARTFHRTELSFRRRHRRRFDPVKISLPLDNVDDCSIVDL